MVLGVVFPVTVGRRCACLAGYCDPHKDHNTEKMLSEMGRQVGVANQVLVQGEYDAWTAE